MGCRKKMVQGVAQRPALMGQSKAAWPVPVAPGPLNRVASTGTRTSRGCVDPQIQQRHHGPTSSLPIPREERGQVCSSRRTASWTFLPGWRTISQLALGEGRETGRGQLCEDSWDDRGGPEPGLTGAVRKGSRGGGSKIARLFLEARRGPERSHILEGRLGAGSLEPHMS